MATCRDWLSTLWAASYKGVPFFIDRDDENGSRRIVVHEFPKRDDPFLEDMGEGARYFEGIAYVAGDAADGLASGLVSVLASEGPGLLVLPTHGPILSRCLTFSRERSKDRHGYIGFKVRFVREGAASALASVTSLANAVSSAVDLLGSAAGLVFATLASAADQPDFVVAAATDRIATVAAQINGVRLSYPVDGAVSTDVRDAVSDLVASATVLVNRVSGADPEYAARVFEMARDLGDGMAGSDAVPAFSAVFDDSAPVSLPSTGSPHVGAAIGNENETSRVLRLAALGVVAEATIRTTFRARPDAITARANIAEQFEAELDLCNGAALAPLAVALQEVRNAAIEYLSRQIIDLAPVITVTANASLPSLYWAWRLYQDPTRATELVERNRVRHPSYFPSTFEALAR